jgi:hypothetical protein
MIERAEEALKAHKKSHLNELTVRQLQVILGVKSQAPPRQSAAKRESLKKDLIAAITALIETEKANASNRQPKSPPSSASGDIQRAANMAPAVSSGMLMGTASASSLSQQADRASWSLLPHSEPPAGFRLPLSIPSLAILNGTRARVAPQDTHQPQELEGMLGVDRKPHFLTGSKCTFLMHDRFHCESHGKCEARSADSIAEMKMVNTSAGEQYNRGNHIILSFSDWFKWA